MACDEAHIRTKHSTKAAKVKPRNAPGAFTVTGPAAFVATASPTVAWKASPGARTYRVTVAASADCAASLQSPADVSETSVVLAPLADGAYFACVTAANEAGTTAAANNGWAFQVKTVPPSDFSVQSPVGPLNLRTPTIRWEAAASAVSYRLQVGKDACLPALQNHTVTATEKTLDPLEDGDYAICVTALDAAGNARPARNDLMRLTIQATPPAPFAIAALASPTPPTPTITWQSAARATRYDLVIATDGACQNVVRRHSGLITTSVSEAALSPGSYHACVTAHDDAGNATAALNDGVPFTILPPPRIDAVSPLSGSRFGGVMLTLTGSGFTADAQVALDGTPCPNVTVVSPTTVTCVTPAHAVGVVDVSIAQGDGQSDTADGAFTYVSFLYATNAQSNDVSGFVVHPETGALTAIPGSPFPAGNHPANITPDPLGRFIYVNSLGSYTVRAYAVDPATGALTPVPGGDVATGGGRPTGSAVDPAGKRLYVPLFDDNKMAIFDIDQATGALSHIAGSPFDLGPSFCPQGPSFDPDGKHMLLPASCANGVAVFGVDPATGGITQIGGVHGTGGNASLIARHPSQAYVFVSNMTSDNASALTWDPVAETLADIPGTPFSTSGAFPSAIRITPDGAFVYAPNYNSQSIAGFRVDPATGALSHVPGSPFATGAFPGDLVIDTRGTFLYVHNDAIDEIKGFAIDPATGALTPIGGGPYRTGRDPGSLAIF